MAIITPTVGRVVWYWPGGQYGKVHGDQPLAAIVTYVMGDNMVNLIAFDKEGGLMPQTRVTLVQDGEPGLAYPFAEWMPYEKGQAAKTEAAEAALQAKG